MNKHQALGQFLGYVVAIFLVPAIFYWYNHVLHWRQFTFWQWFIIGLGWMVVVKMVKPLHWLAGLIGATCIMAQCLAWAGIITLPLIKP